MSWARNCFFLILGCIFNILVDNFLIFILALGYDEGLDKLRGQHLQNLVKRTKLKIDRAGRTGEGKAEDLDEIDMLVLQTKDKSCFYKNNTKDTPVFKTPFKVGESPLSTTSSSSSTTTGKGPNEILETAYSFVVDKPLSPGNLDFPSTIEDFSETIDPRERDEELERMEDERRRREDEEEEEEKKRKRRQEEEEEDFDPEPSTSKTPKLDGVHRRKKKTPKSKEAERSEGTMNFDEFFSLSQQNKRNSNGDDCKKIEKDILLEKRRRLQLENEALEKENILKGQFTPRIIKNKLARYIWDIKKNIYYYCILVKCS